MAYSYSNLGLYYHTARYHKKGFECMLKSLQILQNVAGFNHPDICNIFINLGMMYQDADRLEDAIASYKDCLRRNIDMYGETHLQVASCH